MRNSHRYLVLAFALLASACSSAPDEKSASGSSKLQDQDLPSSTVDRTAFLTVGPWSSGFAQVTRDYDEFSERVCGPDYTINYLVQVGDVTATSVTIESVTIFYHPAFDNWIVPGTLTLWSGGTEAVTLYDELGQGRSEGSFHTYEVHRRFDVGSKGAVLQFTNSGSFPTGIDTEGMVCGTTATIVVQPVREGSYVKEAKFCPRDPVPRQEMAKYLERIKHGAAFTPPPATGRFQDVDPAHAPWAEALARDGVTRGCGTPDATGYSPVFCPFEAVPREQMAAFFVRLRDGRDFVYGKDISGPPNGPFSDVPATDVFAGDIQRLLDYGITKGCGDGKFCPKDVVPREQMAAFLMRYVHGGSVPASRLRFADVSEDSVFVNEIGRAVEDGIMEGCP